MILTNGLILLRTLGTIFTRHTTHTRHDPTGRSDRAESTRSTAHTRLPGPDGWVRAGTGAVVRHDDDVPRAELPCYIMELASIRRCIIHTSPRPCG